MVTKNELKALQETDEVSKHIKAKMEKALDTLLTWQINMGMRGEHDNPEEIKEQQE